MLHFYFSAVALFGLRIAESVMPVAGKRKRKAADKLQIMESLSKGAIQAVVAQRFTVVKLTISDIKTNEKKIQEYATSLDNLGVNSSQKVMRLAKED